MFWSGILIGFCLGVATGIALMVLLAHFMVI